MLLSLHVKNLALIQETEVEFHPGLNILSGETGAGKSIIIGSLNLALGQRVPREMLREQAEYALVELVFSVEDPQILEKLTQLDIQPEEGMVIMSRKITPERSIGKINSETVSASKMREAAALLIDIHGQHEHQSLLHKSKHLEILDEYAREKLQNRKTQLASLFRDYQDLRLLQKKALTDESQRARELSFLEFEIKEIQEAELQPEEDIQLEQQYRTLANGKKILEAVGTAHLQTSDSVSGADQLIGRALRELVGVAEYGPELQSILEQLQDVDSLLNDCNREMAAYLADHEFSQEELYEIEQRLDEINRLKAKYGNSIQEIQDQLQQRIQRYDELVHYEEYIKDIDEKCQKAKEQLETLCQEVSKIRQTQAGFLSKQITQALLELNFLDVAFDIKFYKTEDYTSQGFDQVEFVISTNPGEPLKPLEKVASGGELSRIMLAIKTILASQDQIETMIFDEIDAGISGRTAQMVAEKMNVIGRSHQVICITHLPQIAAMSDYHYLIEKHVEHQATISTIQELKPEESIQELARMIGGVRITETVLDNAREMRQLALNVKKSQIEK